MRNALTAALLFSFYLHPFAILDSEERADTQKALVGYDQGFLLDYV